mgnify:FL=1
MARSTMMTRTLPRFGFGIALALGACSKPAPTAGAKDDVATAPAAPGAAPMLRGDSAGIRHYLETVDTMVGATFDVTWSANAVRLDRATTLRALRQASRDGTVFTFTPDEPAVRALQPGQILLVWGIALLKVTSVEPAADKIVVRGTPASLPEAIDHGHIAWTTPAQFERGMLVEKVIEADPVPVPAQQGLTPSVRPLWLLASSWP